MDRDRRWERIERAYTCMTVGAATTADSAQTAIKNSYDKGVTDEFIEPTNILENGAPVALVKKGDAVIFFNYRIDRPRELTKAFVLDDFEHDANKMLSFDPYAVKYEQSHIPKAVSFNPPFKRASKIEDLFFITMTEYEKDLPVHIAFPPSIVTIPLARVLSDSGRRQLHMSESEKERFVTYYFNGLREAAFPDEDRLIIPSPKVPTYDMMPEMSAYQVTQDLIEKIRSKNYAFILVNFANADMVGHTGNIEASIKAVQTLDQCLSKIVQVVLDAGATMLITADHGNVEQKINPQTGQISTEHTNNPVPFIAVSDKFRGRLARLQSGILADVAPTILSLLDIPRPTEMTGRDLLEEIKQ
jgi:2,3-bisphosphoglycerate-independent phosphoglycerate mutase